MTNPLQKYFRAPKLYVKLPSQGKFYPDKFIQMSVNQEVAVYPLTAMDQILLKTPDAVLNGEALLKVFRSCVPDVADVRQLVEPDINTLMVAIRVASNGAHMPWDTQCPACNHDQTFEVNLSNILDTQQLLNMESVIDFKGELKIHVRPYNFEQRNLQILNEVEESQSMRLVNDNTEISESEKLRQLSELVDKMSDRIFHVLSKSIEKILIVATQETVTDRQHIEAFVKHISKSDADIIMNMIKQMNQTGIDTQITCECESCAHEWKTALDFDPTSFFG